MFRDDLKKELSNIKADDRLLEMTRQKVMAARLQMAKDSLAETPTSPVKKHGLFSSRRHAYILSAACMAALGLLITTSVIHVWNNRNKSMSNDCIVATDNVITHEEPLNDTNTSPRPMSLSNGDEDNDIFFFDNYPSSIVILEDEDVTEDALEAGKPDNGQNEITIGSTPSPDAPGLVEGLAHSSISTEQRHAFTSARKTKNADTMVASENYVYSISEDSLSVIRYGLDGQFIERISFDSLAEANETVAVVGMLYDEELDILSVITETNAIDVCFVTVTEIDESNDSSNECIISNCYSYMQEGSYIDASISGSSIILVSEKKITALTANSIDSSMFPRISDGDEWSQLQNGNVLFVGTSHLSCFTTISSISLMNQGTHTAVTFANNASTVKIDNDSVVFLANMPASDVTVDDDRTKIIRLASDTLAATYSTTVPGRLLNTHAVQFENDHIRLVTLERESLAEGVQLLPSVYVLDHELGLFGSLVKLGYTEPIFSARMDEKSITLLPINENADACVVNLADDALPAMMGVGAMPESKMAIYYLDGEYRLGVGENLLTDSTLTISLYDYTVANEPNMVSSIIFDSGNPKSTATTDADTMFINATQNIYGCPVSYTDETGADVNMFLLFTIRPSDQQLIIVDEIALSPVEGAVRGIMVNGQLYCVSTNGVNHVNYTPVT